MYLATVRRRFDELSSQGSSRFVNYKHFISKHFITDRVVDDHQEKLVKLLHLFVEHVHNKFNKYAFYFFLCELLNIVITVIMVTVRILRAHSYIYLQILFTHVFLHYQYFDYGLNIFKYYRSQ